MTEREQRIISDAIDWHAKHYLGQMLPSEPEEALARAVTALMDERKRLPFGTVQIIRETPNSPVIRNGIDEAR